MSVIGVPLTASRRDLPAPGLVMRLVDRLLDWQDRERQRRHLSSLDDHILADVGLTHGDVEEESRKPFWRA
ncbi:MULTISPECIES: DUF1127 domain-containing protein [Inquilinus]|jgi:uncharacterized protein YjiS (DUF1127 family)|uniref:Uncharacterized protein YjiS (DUF1127 family) n=1 Tax=Inquilinus ginsengisoli TaxID=363840 RepID=A0ABU1JGZ6_9PROT|nr:DUF1127 domain-containing protein [Inquilinus ginsengisoli]MDR6287890.1 uncharacterized protein YjiS (DUF1127 family) [Inquilinus ginsengisoli]